MKPNVNSEYGQIKIYRKVLRQIAEEAAKEVKGVISAGWRCYGLIGRILKIFGLAGTKISFEKDTKIIIPIVASEGENIIDVAYQVQKKIIFKIMNTLNIEPLTVDVKIKKVKKGGM